MCLLLMTNTKETFSMFQKMKDKSVSPSGYLYLQSGTIATLHGGHANNTPMSPMCCLHGVKLESKLFPPTAIHSKFPLANLVGTECLHDAILLRLAMINMVVVARLWLTLQTLWWGGGGGGATNLVMLTGGGGGQVCQAVAIPQEATPSVGRVCGKTDIRGLES